MRRGRSGLEKELALGFRLSMFVSLMTVVRVTADSTALSVAATPTVQVAARRLNKVGSMA